MAKSNGTNGNGIASAVSTAPVPTPATAPSLSPGDMLSFQLSLREVEMVHQGLDALITQAQLVQMKLQASARMAITAKQQAAAATSAAQMQQQAPVAQSK